MNITVGDGKYTFVLRENGTIEKILRHGEEWPAADDLRGSKVVLALVHEIDWLCNVLSRMTGSIKFDAKVGIMSHYDEIIEEAESVLRGVNRA